MASHAITVSCVPCQLYRLTHTCGVKDGLLEAALIGLCGNLVLVDLADLCGRRTHIQVLNELVKGTLVTLGLSNDLQGVC